MTAETMDESGTRTIERRLAQAQDALHRLMTGAHVVSVAYDGGTTTFNRASVPELRRYIASLKRQLGRRLAPVSREVSF